MTCPHCCAPLYRTFRGRVLLVCRRPWISGGMEGDRAVVTVVLDCLRCRRQVRIVDLAAEMKRAMVFETEHVSAGA